METAVINNFRNLAALLTKIINHNFTAELVTAEPQEKTNKESPRLKKVNFEIKQCKSE